jgi:hypothetical protein
MPNRQRRTSEVRVTSRPSNDTLPVEARSTPVTSLNNVDLPAPLGPIRAWRAPGATSRSTPATALSAPKDRLTPAHASTGVVTSPPSGGAR